MGGRLFCVGNDHFRRVVFSTMRRAAVKPHMDLMSKKVKSTWNKVPGGSSVVSTNGPLGSLVAPPMMQMGHGARRGDNFVGKPFGTLIIPWSIMSWRRSTDWWPQRRWRNMVKSGAAKSLRVMVRYSGGGPQVRWWTSLDGGVVSNLFGQWKRRRM